MQEQDREVPFPRRDFVFFDEAHKVDEIVQNHFSPRIDRTLITKVLVLNGFLQKWAFNQPRVTKNKLESIFNTLLKTTDKPELLMTMKELKKFKINMILLLVELLQQCLNF